MSSIFACSRRNSAVSSQALPAGLVSVSRRPPHTGSAELSQAESAAAAGERPLAGATRQPPSTRTAPAIRAIAPGEYVALATERRLARGVEAHIGGGHHADRAPVHAPGGVGVAHGDPPRRIAHRSPAPVRRRHRIAAPAGGTSRRRNIASSTSGGSSRAVPMRGAARCSSGIRARARATGSAAVSASLGLPRFGASSGAACPSSGFLRHVMRPGWRIHSRTPCAKPSAGAAARCPAGEQAARARIWPCASCAARTGRRAGEQDARDIARMDRTPAVRSARAGGAAQGPRAAFVPEALAFRA